MDDNGPIYKKMFRCYAYEMPGTKILFIIFLNLCLLNLKFALIGLPVEMK